MSDFFSGFLVIQIDGKQIERFVNLCKNRGICLEKIEFLSLESMRCSISIKDFRSIQVIRRKTGVRIKILHKQGLPFFFLHHKKRKAFFLGLLCLLGAVYLCSMRIWMIQIRGNQNLSSAEIMKFLEAEGVFHGIEKDNVDCGEIVEMLRNEYDSVTWASASLEGSTLSIELKEGVLLEEITAKKEPCHLLADKAGTIVKMVTRSGVPVKKQGESCEKGDILVEGRIEILNDNKEVIRYEYVAADADIYIQHKIPYYHEIPLEYTRYEDTGKRTYGLGLQVGKLYLELDKANLKNRDEQLTWFFIEDITDISLTESFSLPVQLKKIQGNGYEKRTKSYTKEEIEQVALKELHKYEENLIQKGVQIFANNVTIKFNQKLCVSSGYLEIIEKIGKEDPVLSQEQPIRKDIEE